MDELTSTPGAIDHIEEMARKPFILIDDETVGPHIAVPDGYTVQDFEKHLAAPRRAKGTTTLHDVESFIETCKRYGSLSDAVIYVDADYGSQKISATAVFNDHGDDPQKTGWRDHRARFAPRFTQEWKRWMDKSGKPMSQTEFAFFLEANLPEIVTPPGGEVLEFVTNLQDTRQATYGRAVNLQNGMVQIEFTEKGDDGTKGKLDLFREFTLALRPFEGGEPYSVKALLRYRIDRNSGDIAFWFDIPRPERILEDACKETVEKIRRSAGLPVVFGTPE